MNERQHARKTIFLKTMIKMQRHPVFIQKKTSWYGISLWYFNSISHSFQALILEIPRWTRKDETPYLRVPMYYSPIAHLVNLRDAAWHIRLIKRLWSLEPIQETVTYLRPLGDHISLKKLVSRLRFLLSRSRFFARDLEKNLSLQSFATPWMRGYQASCSQSADAVHGKRTQ